ncbi:SOS response-associated peptidase family protein [Pseudomonas sp. MSSRFD41]|uniref:SOS response-associated peptidase family protein n=1 Tax=Pseudomonas sp. MSSRFD41 TaxID=1310370 RepID=UPI0021ADD1BB|nr:SOS response-associated peptidase family protein [Pseudomonas sp. MSSRFD41]
MAQWRRYLDDQESRFNNPEVHRSMCRLLSQDMLDERIISAAEKFELDELADAAYWHAVETLIDCEPDFMPSGFYDLIARDGGPSIGKLSGTLYYPADRNGYAAQVIGERGNRRLVFRMTRTAWKIDGMTITTPNGRIHDLVITGQRINGIEYTNIDAQGGMVDIHDRRPVVLAPDLAREWLDPATPKERAEQMALYQGEPSELFEWFRVSTAVGNVRNHGAELIEPMARPS